MCVVLGVLATLSSAWVSALRPIEQSRTSVVEGFSRRGAGYADWWVTVTSRRAGVLVRSAWATGDSAYLGVGRAQSAEELLPRWAGFVRPSTADTAIPYVFRYAEAHGWPMLALWSGREYDAFQTAGATISSAVKVQHGYLLPQDRHKPHDLVAVVRVIPLAPIWPGFLGNTMIYAGALWLLHWTVVMVRRLARLRTGRCPRCAYDLSGNFGCGCPECGWRRRIVGRWSQTVRVRASLS